MAMEFRAKREPDRGGEEAVEVKIVGFEGKMAVPVHILTTWEGGMKEQGLNATDQLNSPFASPLHFSVRPLPSLFHSVYL